MKNSNNVRRTSVADRANRHKIKSYKFIRDIASGKTESSVSEQIEANYYLIKIAEEGNRDVCQG